LKDVSFEVKHGEVVGIIGRNGAGKSTLLKILSRITEPTRGGASVYGRLGSLLEVGTGFHPDLTGRENVYLNGTILGMKKREIDTRFDEIVDFSGVEKFIDTPVKRYSSGMRVRLAFSVAAHLELEILLVDEVLAVGDAEFQKKCLGKMGDVARQGRTILFVSHNMAAVEQLCSRAIVLSAGRITAACATNSAIHSYLAVDERSKAIREDVLARSADGSLELLSLGPAGENGEPLAMAQCGRDLYLALTLRASKSLPDSTVSVGINSLHEVRIATLHSTIAGAHLSIPKGTHTIVCRVPHLGIAPGCYSLDAKVYAGAEVALWAPRVQQLVVEQGDFFETGKLPASTWGGVCYLDQEWIVNNSSKTESSPRRMLPFEYSTK
jgi:lipopolysaccharide transport system ATP-binding protein